MWLAENWKEYEVIDCSGGEKLERWGKYLLVRPDPQVIWDTPKKEKGWNKHNGHYYRSSKGGGEWEFFDLPKQWDIHYRNLTFHLKPFRFKHTGLFPEQAVNWDWCAKKIEQSNRPVKVLNLADTLLCNGAFYHCSQCHWTPFDGKIISGNVFYRESSRDAFEEPMPIFFGFAHNLSVSLYRYNKSKTKKRNEIWQIGLNAK